MALTLVLDLSASLAMGLVDGAGSTRSARVKEKARGEEAHGILDALLAEAGVGIESIEDIAVGIGPGSFTGIRVAVALAQGLAFANRLPLHPFSTLAALRACSSGGPVETLAAIAAVAGRWYVSSGRPAVEALRTTEELIALARPGLALATFGPIPEPERLSEAFPSRNRFEETVDFGKVAALARAGTPVLDGVIRPNYLMQSAAEAKRLATGASAAEAKRLAEGSPGAAAP